MSLDGHRAEEPRAFVLRTHCARLFSTRTGRDFRDFPAAARACETVDNVRWFEVLSTRGHVEGGKVSHYQATLKVGFTVKE